MTTRRSLSLPAVATAVGVAFLVGLVASLALRPPGDGGPARASPGDTERDRSSVRWKLSSAFSTRLPILGETVVEFTDSVAAASGGRVVIVPYDPGELVPAFSITEAVREGKIEAGMTWLGYDQGRIPASPLLGAVPFGMEPWEFMAWWYFAGGRELGEGLYHKHGIQPLLCGLIGPETAGWYRVPITSADDLQGLKIRFAGLGGQVMQRMGASVTTISAGEIFQALEKGAIDATEFSQPAVDQLLGFDRIAPFNYYPGWHQPSSAFHLVVNLDIWRALDEPDRHLIQTACKAATTYGLALSESAQGAVVAGFADRNVTVGRLPLALLERLAATTETVLAQEAADDTDFARILESQKAFRATYRHWKRVAYLPRDFQSEPAGLPEP